MRPHEGCIPDASKDTECVRLLEAIDPSVDGPGNEWTTRKDDPSGSIEKIEAGPEPLLETVAPKSDVPTRMREAIGWFPPASLPKVRSTA